MGRRRANTGRTDADATYLSVLDVGAVAGRNRRGAERLDLVEGLKEMAMEAGLVTHDLVQVVLAGEEAVHGAAIHHVFEVGRQRFRAGRRYLHVLAKIDEAGGDYFALITEDAHDTPEDGGGAVGERTLEATLRIDLVEDGVTEGEPVVLVFEPGDDGGDGEDAVFDGVERDEGDHWLDGR